MSPINESWFRSNYTQRNAMRSANRKKKQQQNEKLKWSEEIKNAHNQIECKMRLNFHWMHRKANSAKKNRKRVINMLVFCFSLL